MKFSVLLSVYAKEKPEYMLQCFESIYSQTLPPAEIVLVEDGTLTTGLYEVIASLKKRDKNLKTVAYKNNRGLGYALNIGLRHCSHDIVARMDTDDICYPDRFRRQIRFLESHPDIDVVGTWIDEFVNDITDVRTTRVLPETHEQIFQFAKHRNPINHPTVMFRKQAVTAVGGYRPFYLFEDYYLWIRLLLAEYRFYNIQQSLLYFRQTEDMFDRRGGIEYCKSEIRFQKYLYRIRFINFRDLAKNIAIRTFMRLIPNRLRRIIYLKFLR